MKSIQSKLSLLIGGLIGMTAVIIAGFLLWQLYHNMTVQLAEDTSALGAAYSRAVGNQMDSFKRELELAAAIPDLLSEDAAQRDATLQRLAAATGFQYLAIADSQGKTTRNSDISQREYFQKALGGTTFTSSPLVNLVDGTVTIMMATPLGSGRVLYGGIPYDTFSQVIQNLSIGEGGYAFVVDAQGSMVAHPDGQLVADMVNYIQLAQEDGSYQPVAAVISRMAAGEQGSDTQRYLGEWRLYGFAPLAGPEGWSAAVSVPLNRVMTKTYTAMVMGLVAALLLAAGGLVLAMGFSRSITRPLVAVTQRIELLDQGDLSHPVPEIQGKDELARLSAALGGTITRLHDYIEDISGTLTAMANRDFTVVSNTAYVGEFAPIRKALSNIAAALSYTLSLIRTATSQVSSSAEQIAMGAQSLAASSSQQAALVTSLEDGISQITQRDAQNLQMLHQAAQTMEEANAGVQSSADEMRQLNQSMQQIADSSQQISNITQLIEDIAFQTNILALNAAIEAARAGAAGKGFAVVADEVRNLAAKSAEAAKRTAVLIQESVEAVAGGTSVAEQTVQRLAQVARQTRDATQSIRDIQAVSDTQALSIRQISESISQVSVAVQANAATAEESSASSEELSAIARELKQEVSQFRLRVSPQETVHSALGF